MTKRLRFRTWLETDRQPFAELNADPVVMEFFPKTLDRAESDAFVDRIERHLGGRNYGLWAVELLANQKFIGYIGFNYTGFQSEFTPCIEIGWRLARAFWGKGYATEGATACLKYGFAQLRFDKVYSFTSVLNKRSERVMQKIGMHRAKTFMHPKLEPSHPLCEHVLYHVNRLKPGIDR